MLRIYRLVLEVIRLLKPVVAIIAKHDLDLARQLKRAANSIALNIQEGSGLTGGLRIQRYRTALGSTRESISCLELADAWGYWALDAQLVDKLEHIAAVLVKLQS